MNPAKALWCILALSVYKVKAQLPAVCIENNQVMTRCCPIPSGTMSECGAPQRGDCVEISLHNDWPWAYFNNNCVPGDARIGWPKSLNMTYHCQCKNHWAGPACEDCAHGYTRKGNSCIPQNPPIIRKNALTMTPAEWKNFLLVLNEAKHTNSSYKVPIGYYNTNEGGVTANLTFLDITVYNLFVWLHHFVAKDNVGPTKMIQCDFAHEASGLLTWHRAALLVVEHELQKTPTGQRLSYPIAIPYWDWTNHSPESINQLFSNERMGYSRNVTDTKEPQPIGGVFSNWTTICYKEGFPEKPTLECLCDPRISTGHLKRCLGCKDTLLHKSMDYLPLKSDVEKVKSLSWVYDIPPWDKIPNIISFRNSLEGFVNMSHIYHFGSGQNGELHVQVHWWMGGNVAELSSAPNDPMFWLHHCMIDRIFEEWLRMKPRTYEPKTGAHPGHNRDDWLVGIYPLVTNDDMFKNSTMLGYNYDKLNGQSNHKITNNAVNPEYNLYKVFKKSTTPFFEEGIALSELKNIKYDSHEMWRINFRESVMQ